MSSQVILCRSISLALGTTTVTCFLAAAEVWDYPYARAALGNIGLFLLAGTIAFVILSVVESARAEHWPFWIKTGGLIYVPVFILLSGLGLWNIALAMAELHYFWPCFTVNSPDICSMATSDIATIHPDVRSKLASDVQQAAGPLLWMKFITGMMN